MRFSLLPIGESFEFQNERYCKNGPLTAVNLENNRQRMIPRSALVQSESTTSPDNPPEPPASSLDARRVSVAFARYHEACLKLLTTNDNKRALEKELESLRQQFLTDCGLE
jgi:hypothetical protein